MFKKKWLWFILIPIVIFGFVSGNHHQAQTFFMVNPDGSYTYEIVETNMDATTEQRSIIYSIIIPQNAAQSQIETIYQDLVTYTLDKYQDVDNIQVVMYDQKEHMDEKHIVKKMSWPE